jgi:hypothetical protein
MKKVFLSLFVAGFLLSACNNNVKNEHEGHDMTASTTDSPGHLTTPPDKNIKTVPVTFAGIDSKASLSIKEIVDHYLHIKNALVNSNSNDAVSGAKAMLEAMKKLDKSLLTAEQKTAYDKTENELKEHAMHVADNGGKIDQQRSHFAMMSEEAYELIKNFGAGRPVYHDHCPMARDNKGAMWISENKDIRNPYFGEKMPTCGTVEEVIQ